MDTAQGTTVAELLLARADDEHPGLQHGERSWSWREHVATCARYGAALGELRRPRLPWHVGILADNRPEFSFLLGGAALSGAVLVGLNTTRSGAALARDIRRSDCGLVLADSAHAALLGDVDPGIPLLRLDSADWRAVLEAQRGAPLPRATAKPDDLLMLIFTSGTSGEPKAVRCTHAKISAPGVMLADRFGLSTSDTVYVSMPMFHSNAIMAGWAVGVAAGATIALRDRFSASGFLPDVRRFGATYANYVGTPLSYVLATPERADDADNPLRVVYGNEGAQADLARFAERFGCRVVDGFGSTEGGVAIARTPDTPPGALGRLTNGTAVLHPETAEPCPPARFDSAGRLVNAEAIGELVNTAGAGAFAGYYNEPGADADRLRNGMYFSGDLAYADADGYAYFVGRSGDWLRVGGENLGTAPIERVLLRHDDVAEAAVYAVRGVGDGVGDQVMATLVLRPGAEFDPAGFGAFLAAQRDMSRIQWPRYVRVSAGLPRTPTHKTLKRVLTAAGLGGPDPIWSRSGRDAAYRAVTPVR